MSDLTESDLQDWRALAFDGLSDEAKPLVAGGAYELITEGRLVTFVGHSAGGRCYVCDELDEWAVFACELRPASEAAVLRGFDHLFAILDEFHRAA